MDQSRQRHIYCRSPMYGRFPFKIAIPVYLFVIHLLTVENKNETLALETKSLAFLQGYLQSSHVPYFRLNELLHYKIKDKYISYKQYIMKDKPK